mgnify:FL=1
MQKALKDIPIMERPIPNGVIQADGDYFYIENPPGSAIKHLGAESEIIIE